jgi:hypothetical protein
LYRYTEAEYNKFADPTNFTGAYAANVGVEVRQRGGAVQVEFS